MHGAAGSDARSSTSCSLSLSGRDRMDLLAEDAAAPFYESLPHKTKPGYRLYRA